MKDKKYYRNRRKKGIRKKIFGTIERPRLSIFRTTKHIYAQLVNDTTGKTIVAASTLSPAIKAEMEGKNKTEVAALVGKLVAKIALEKEVKKVVYDRNGFKYHGRIKALADAAREVGLEF